MLILFWRAFRCERHRCARDVCTHGRRAVVSILRASCLGSNFELEGYPIQSRPTARRRGSKGNTYGKTLASIKLGAVPAYDVSGGSAALKQVRHPPP